MSFDFSIDHLLGSKTAWVVYISLDPQQKAVNISTYDEQFIVTKLDAIKRKAKSFLLNAENYTDFAARNPLTKPVTNNPHSSNKLCTKFSPRNREYSEITKNDNRNSKLTPKNSHFSDKIVPTNILHSLFALNRPTNQLKEPSNNFKQKADNFQIVSMMSRTHEATL